MEMLIVDDDPLLRTATMQMAEDAGHDAEAAANGTVALTMIKESAYDLVLLDLQLGEENGLNLLPRIHELRKSTPVIILTANASIPAAVEAMRLGAIDFLEKPFSEELLGLALQKARNHRRLAQQVESLSEEISRQHPEPQFETSAPGMREALKILFRSADTEASILILGETGTGKSWVAREIHARSKRRKNPLVTINCPALSRELLESELFGHVKGAFTGAVRDAWGKVRAAEGGTLFLDEIGELPKEIQPKLLRLLQDREYERVGEATVRKADVRVVAATNRDLVESVRQGAFREDLYFRLNVISVTLPPMRERRDDLIRFAQSYLSFFASQYGRPAAEFSAEAMQTLLRHSWPGNLRELRNAVERAVILSQSSEIVPSDFPASMLCDGENGAAVVEAPQAGDLITMENLNQAHMRLILHQSKTLSEAARTLGIDHATLYRWRKKYKL
ncbi:MAG TPA: sigma-54 dependent transcriptional regulator [Verrucomicrobiales bacterium]|nr:sigma-54 dependent transcriptional regulator [Verrucomicrobiales bacterium]